MKRYIILAISICCAFGQFANATISIFVDSPPAVEIPAVSTPVQVPVKLFSDTAVAIDGYSVPLDYEPLPGGFSISNPTSVTLIEDFAFAFGVLTSDLVVADSVLLNNGPLNVAANETVTLFNLNFNVTPSADPGTVVPIVLAPDAMGVGSLYSVNVNGVANPIQPAFSGGSISTVPEPSQLILVCMMVGLGLVSIKKRIQLRANKS